jgi:23S rRNA pseudouridine1911/1915/1917 synthase
LRYKKQSLEYIFEDDDIIVLSKPAGVLTIPDRYDKNAPNLRQILTEKYGQIFVVHRLDRDTSGIMIFAKNAEAHRNLSMQFEALTVKKVYHCLVSGSVITDEIEIDIPLMTDPNDRGRTIPSVRGKSSLTIMRVIKRFRSASLVKCLLVTGRHHQIRAHLAAIGHPMLVDPMYGKSESFKLSMIKRRYNLQKNTEETPLIGRVSMHSKEIGFKHPSTNEDVEFSCDYPKDIEATIQVLDKYSSIS